MNAFDVLAERGFIEQVTDEKEVRDHLGRDKVTCYIGFDPTASSLHIGSLVPIMALAHMQRLGHRPIVLIGGGTALIGDPSGKTEMRQILSLEQVNENASALKAQLSRYVDFTGGRAVMLNNAEWLTRLNYIEFLRDIGRHFSVNRMLAAESYRMRLEKGLNFIEFNYMLLQAYDFYHLRRHHDCTLQMGGNDQWGNIVAGIDLTRRLEGKTVYGVTFPLLTTSQGHKMGKTERGTVWLDPVLTSPYEYFQYWMNTEDADVGRFLSLFTFLPLEEIVEVRKLKDARLNMAKTVLAFEATKTTHGREEAEKAWQASAEAFNLNPVEQGWFPSSTIPRDAGESAITAIPFVIVSSRRLGEGIPAFELFFESGLCTSKGEARRLLDQGGGYINGRAAERFDARITRNDVDGQGEIRLRKGKKRFVVVRVEEC